MIEHSAAPRYRGKAGPLRGRSRNVEFLLDEGADTNLVSQRLIRELDMKPIEGAKLPVAKDFKGQKGYVYGAHTLRVRLTDSLGTTKDTFGTFYAMQMDPEGPDVLLGNP
jgi:hypothetical protein